MDPSGSYGSMLHFALVSTFVLGAFIIFIQLWRNGRLDMDELPKFQMMQSEEEQNEPTRKE